MALNLYLVEREDTVDYDENRAHVIAAANPYEARIHASKASADEESAVWFEESTAIRVLGVASESIPAGVVLSDFNAG